MHVGAQLHKQKSKCVSQTDFRLYISVISSCKNDVHNIINALIYCLHYSTLCVCMKCIMILLYVVVCSPVKLTYSFNSNVVECQLSFQCYGCLPILENIILSKNTVLFSNCLENIDFFEKCSYIFS